MIILKTVLLHFSNIQDSQNQKLMTTILKVSHETDFEFKCCLFELIYVIFKQDLIKKENIGNELLSFLIKESEYDESNINNINNENYPFLSNSKFVIEQAEFTLLNILNKIEFEKIFDHVYPYIFTVFINKFYDKCQFIICKMINTIFDNALKTNNQIDEKIKENEKDENSTINIEPNYISLRLDYKKYPLLPYSQNILIKMLLILSNPLLKNNFISIALLTLKNILTLLSHSEDTLINQNIKSDKIEEYISKNKNYFNYFDYYELLTELFNEILKYDNQDENNTKSNIQFISLCLQVINDYIIEYKNNTQIISLLMCFEGVILGKINLTESIKNNLEKLFSIVHSEYKDGKFDKNEKNIPSNELREGLCLCFAYTSLNQNIDIVLDKINLYFKSEIIEKKQKGFTSFFNMKNHQSDIPKQAIETLIKILGYIAKYNNVKDIISRLDNHFLNIIDNYYNKFQKKNNEIKLACLFSYGKVFEKLNEDKDFILKQRDDYLNKMIIEFTNEKEINLIKENSLNNISYLIMLNPVIPLEKCKMIIEKTFTIFNYLKTIDNKSNIINLILKAISFNLFSFCHFNTYKNSPNVDNSTNINEKIDSNEKNNIFNNFSIIGYDYMIDYSSKNEINNFEMKNYIFEKFVEKYSKIDLMINEANDNKNQDNINIKFNLITYLSKTLEEFILLNENNFNLNNNDKQFENWIVYLTCTLLYYLDGNKNISKCIEKILKDYEIDISNLDFSEENKFINNFSKLLINVFNIEKIFEILSKFIYLANSKISNVSDLSINLIINIITNTPGYFLNKIILNEEKETKIDNKFLNKFYRKYINLLDKSIKEDESKTTLSIKHLLKISQAISKINYDIILSYSLDKKTIEKNPNSLILIISNLSEDKNVILKIISRLTGILNNSSPIINEEKELIENKPYYTICRSTILLGVILKSRKEQISPLIKQYFPQLLCTILLRIGSTYSFKYNENEFLKKEDIPKNQCLYTLRNLFYYLDDCKKILDNNNSIYTKLLSEDEYDEGIYELMILYCKYSNYNEYKKIFDFLSEFTKRKYKGQRLICAICFSVLVNFSSILHIRKDIDGNSIRNYRNNLIISLLNMINDKEFLIRKMAIRGIGNLGIIYNECCDDIESLLSITFDNKNIDLENNDELKENAKNELKDKIMSIFYPDENNNYHILDNMINKIDDPENVVIKESLNSLNNIIDLLSVDIVYEHLNILEKLKINFNNSNNNIRSLSFSVFGKIINLLVFTIHSNNNNFTQNLIQNYQNILIENIHNNIICFLLHFIDENENVSNNSKEILLKSLFILFQDDFTPIYDEIKKNETDREIIYEKFIIKIIDIIIDSFPEKIPSYITDCIEFEDSNQVNIKAYSIYLMTQFYSICVKKEKNEIIKNINVEGIFEQFVKLLNDKEQKVKIKCMLALNIFNSK